MLDFCNKAVGTLDSADSQVSMALWVTLDRRGWRTGPEFFEEPERGDRISVGSKMAMSGFRQNLSSIFK